MTEKQKQVFNPCPKCGYELVMGYGMAGGGIGPYQYCSNERCDHFEKWPEENVYDGDVSWKRLRGGETKP